MNSLCFFISLNWDSQNYGKHLEPELSLWVLCPGLGEVTEMSRISWFPMSSWWRAYLFVSAHKTLPQISVTAEYSVSFTLSLWKQNCKFIYQLINHTGGSRSSLCGLVLKIRHSHQFSLPGICCLPWDFSEVKALLTVSKATRKSSLNEIYQTNRQLLSSFQHSSKPLSPGEAEGKVSSTCRGKTSVGEWSLVHLC